MNQQSHAGCNIDRESYRLDSWSVGVTPVELGHRTISARTKTIISRVSDWGKTVLLAARHALNLSVVVIDVITGRQYDPIVAFWIGLE